MCMQLASGENIIDSTSLRLKTTINIVAFHLRIIFFFILFKDFNSLARRSIILHLITLSETNRRLLLRVVIYHKLECKIL